MFRCPLTGARTSSLHSQTLAIPDSDDDSLPDSDYPSSTGRPSVDSRQQASASVYSAPSSSIPDAPSEFPDIVVDDQQDPQKPRGRRKETATQQLATAMALYELTDVQTFWEPQLDTKALLAWNRHRVLLAFRGTASFANAWSDLKVGPSSTLLRGQLCRCECMAQSHTHATLRKQHPWVEHRGTSRTAVCSANSSECSVMLARMIV